MNLHATNVKRNAYKSFIEHFGIAIQCSGTISASLVRAILSQDVQKVKHLISVENATVNELCPCWTKDDDAKDSAPVSFTLTPLSLATRFSANCMIRSLLRLGADPNVICDMTPLGVAVQRNNRKQVALLLDSGADINLLTHPVMKWKSSDRVEESEDRPMQTPLHIACRKGFVAMTAYLLLKQAATDIIDGSGNSPVNVARKCGHRKIEQLILRESACRHTSISVPSTPCCNENIGITTYCERTITMQLIAACICNDMKKADCLLAEGANVNATDDSLNTALHYACTSGNQKLVKLLLKHDAYTDALNTEQKSPVQVALEYGYAEIAFILIEHKCVVPYQLLFAANSGDNTLLHIACKQKRIPVVRQLLKQGALLNVANKKGKSPIHYAWQSGSIELIRTVMYYIFLYYVMKNVERWELFDVAGMEWFKRYVELATYKILIEVVSQGWRGSLADNSEFVHWNLCSACGKLTPGACYFLLSRGMYISALVAGCCKRPCKSNCTSMLHIACCMKQAESSKLVEQLIEQGADVNVVDCQGNTPLHLVCRYSVDSYSVVNKLLDNGASPYIVNDEGKMALWYAFSKNYSKLVRYLVLNKKIDVDSEVLHGFNDNENTLLLMLATDDDTVDDELLWKLVERSGRINVPPRTACNQSVNASVSRRNQPSLLDVLARRNWSSIRKLVEVGCCDFTTEMFRFLGQPRSNEQFMRSRIEMWKWFRLAGFGQYDGFNTQLETFLREFYLRQAHSEDDVDTFRPHWASSGANAKTRITLKWLRHDMENPSSLSRLCVYTIRRQLIYADPDGKSIFPGIDELPLPTRLKDSLKLRHEECDAECFLYLDYFSSIRRYSVSGYLRSIWLPPIGPRSLSSSSSPSSTVDGVDSIESNGKTSHFFQRRSRKNNYTPKFGRKHVVSHSLRRSRTLVQPRRHH